MTTALDIITRALKVRRVIGNNQTANGNAASNGLTSLNAMLKTWSGQRLMLYQINTESLTLAAGQASRTIGSGGNFNTARPVRLLDSYVLIDDVSWPVRVVAVEEYVKICAKAEQDIPQVMAYRPAYPLGIIYFWPTPADAYALRLESWKALQQFSTLTTDYAMPDEYEEAVVYNLARRMGYMGGTMDDDDIRIASEGVQTVRSVNAAPRRSIGTELGAGFGSHDGAASADLGELPWP